MAAPDYDLVGAPGDDPVRLLRVPIDTTSVTVDGKDALLTPGVDWAWAVLPGKTREDAVLVIDGSSGRIEKSLGDVLVEGLVVGLQ
ncbi:MAG: hypothetical protein U0Q15_01030 [Kineosporiaceae bacterium]